MGGGGRVLYRIEEKRKKKNSGGYKKRVPTMPFGGKVPCACFLYEERLSGGGTWGYGEKGRLSLFPSRKKLFARGEKTS